MQRKRHILSSNVSTEYKPFLLRNQSDRRTDRFIDRHAYSNNAVSNVAVNNRETTAEHDESPGENCRHDDVNNVT